MGSYLTTEEQSFYEAIKLARAKPELSEQERLVVDLWNHNWRWTEIDDDDLRSAHQQVEEGLARRILSYGDTKLRTLLSSQSGTLLREPGDDFFSEWPWVNGWSYRNSTPPGRVGYALNGVKDELYESVIAAIIQLVSIGHRLNGATGRFIYSGERRTPSLEKLRMMALKPEKWSAVFDAKAYLGWAVPNDIVQELSTIDLRPLRDVMRALNEYSIQVESGSVTRRYIKVLDSPQLLEIITVQFTNDPRDTYMFFTGYKEGN